MTTRPVTVNRPQPGRAIPVPRAGESGAVRSVPGRLAWLMALFVLGPMVACSGKPGEPPSPGVSVGVMPSLRGATILLLPVQRKIGVGPEVDSELAYALRLRGPDTEWVGPEQIRRVTAQAVMDVPIDRLPIDMFFRAEVDRVGDPVYGMLRRVSALTDAEMALIPLGVSVRQPTDEVEEAIEVMATLIDIRTGRVFWIGTEEGVGDATDPGTLATAMESLARRIYP